MGGGKGESIYGAAFELRIRGHSSWIIFDIFSPGILINADGVASV